MRRMGLMLLALLLLSACGTNAVPSSTVAPEATPAPAMSGLFEQREDGYRLRPDWEVMSIAYHYGWVGLGGETDETHTLERTDSGYQRKDGTAVDAAAVAAFLTALDGLHPSPGVAYWQSQFDNYPSWSITLAGADGEVVSIFSSNTGNPNNGPWNILYKGQIYLQYDGALVAPLEALFETEEGAPAAMMDLGGPQDVVMFEVDGTQPLPALGVDDIEGLIVTLNAADPGVELSGEIGPDFYRTRGEIIAADVQSLEVSADGDAPVKCTLTPAPDTEGSAAFSCPLTTGVDGEAFRYTLLLGYHDRAGQLHTQAGSFWGTWGAPSMRDPTLPPELLTALAASPEATELLAQLQLGGAIYTAVVSGSSITELWGEVLLRGETQVDGRAVPYTMRTPFRVKDGTLTLWTLSAADVEGMLGPITSSPLTKRVLEEDAAATIDLFYAEELVDAETFNISSFLDMRETAIASCGAIPGGIFPSEKFGPARLFSFNATRPRTMYYGTHGNQFALIGDRIVLSEIDLDPSAAGSDHEPPDKTLTALIPVGLDTEVGRGLERLWVYTDVWFTGREDQASKEGKLTNTGMSLVVWGPEGVQGQARDAINQLLIGQVGPNISSYDHIWERSGVAVAVNAEGRLELGVCKP